MDSATIDPQFLIIEIAVYVVSILALRHASQRGRRRVAELLAAMLYGILLEMLTIAQAQNYGYGRFALMIGHVPLSIGMGWGLIIYSAMGTSDLLELPVPVRPMLDALLAVHIDFTMDPVANHIGMWVYAGGGPWFGVPYGNYFGWLAAVGSFSAAMRLVRAVSRDRSALFTALTIPLALVSLGVLNQLLLLYLRLGYPGGVLVWTVIGLFLLMIATQWRHSHLGNPPDLLILSIPLLFQVFFTALVFANGYAQTVPGLAAMALLVGAAGLLAYLSPSWYHVRERLVSVLRVRRGHGDV